MNKKFGALVYACVIIWIAYLSFEIAAKHFFDQKVWAVSPYGTLLKEYEVYETSDGYEFLFWRENFSAVVQVFKGDKEINTIWCTVDNDIDREVDENTGGHTIHNFKFLGEIYFIVE